MRQSSRILAVTLVAAGVVVGAGCGPDPNSPRQLAAGQRRPLRDVPVPEDFRRADARSVGYADNEMRLACLVYRGKATVYEVSQFYKREMPASHGWTADSEALAGGVMEFRFRKAQARAVIRVRQDGGNAEVTIILAEIGPQGP